MGENQRVSREAEREPKSHPLLIDVFIRLFREKPLGTIGGAIVLILFLTAVFADVLAPYGYDEMLLSDRLQPSSPQHLLGTDNLGQDILSRIIFGARISMYVGLGGATLEIIVAMLIGLISGFFSGKTDLIIQRFVDAWMCFPPLFIYLTVMAVLGPGLIQVILVLGISTGIRSSRVVRSAVIGIRENVYVEAARAIGAPNIRILTRHILPNVMAPVIIIFTLAMGQMILAEATLSFLGFGIPPPMPSWGGMLSGRGRSYMLQAPWMALWPGLALAIVVYGINMLGDAIRDLLDPRLRGGLGRYSGIKRKMPKPSI
ncbi:MAG: ABC transporter permease [Dehalococcoidales bacterium]|nr:ABC transporter permease [Dehalococcoidales bacterium]